MLPSDYAFLALIAMIIIALVDSDSGPGGGKRSRTPVAIRA
jgi:hypothetical protein